MEEVYNPYTQQQTPAQPQQQVVYNPQPNSYTAAGQQLPPQQQQVYVQPPQPVPQQVQPPVYPQNGQLGQQPQQANVYNPYAQGGGQQAPVQAPPAQAPRTVFPKLPTQSGQPMGNRHLVVIDGYLNSPKYTPLANGARLGFFILWERQIWENGQPKRDQNGMIEIRDERFLCQAWGDLANGLAQLPEGTPITIYGMVNRWNAARQGQPDNWLTDIRVNKVELL